MRAFLVDIPELLIVATVGKITKPFIEIGENGENVFTKKMD